MRFFECNLPLEAPEYILTPNSRVKMEAVLATVHNRMEKLEQALLLSGLPGEQFSVGAKMFFDTKDKLADCPLLDMWSAEELAANVRSIAANATYAPRFEWKNADVVVDTAFITIPEWEVIRCIGLGGSDAAVAMDLSPYRTPQQLYHDKIGTEMKIEESDNGKQFIFSYGHKVESLVIEEFCRKTGAVVIPETRMFSKKGMPYITANIDAIVIFPDGRIFVFEAKTTTLFNRNAWEDGNVPTQYIPQCRQYTSVLNDERIAGTYIGCIYGNTPNDFKCSFVPRDINLENEQLEIEKSFWHNYILSGIEPEPSGVPAADIEVLRKTKVGYADKDLPPVNLETDYTSTIEEYLQLDAERKVLEKKAEGIKERQAQISLDLMLQLGKNTKGILPRSEDDFYEVSWKPRAYTSVDKEKLRLMYPEAYDDVVSTNPESSRSFSIKVKKQKDKKHA